MFDVAAVPQPPTEDALLGEVHLERLEYPDHMSMTSSECLASFPRLYVEAERAKRWYAGHGGITESMVRDAYDDEGNANARLVIHNNIVRPLF
jgi:hypothetical protein